jgi:hypothetical protein
MVKRLKKVNVMSTIYKVSYHKDMKKVNGDDTEGQLSLGIIDYIAREIRIFDNGNKEEVFKTLIHEIMHAIAVEMCISECWRPAVEERIIDGFAVGLADTLLRNGLIKL